MWGEKSSVSVNARDPLGEKKKSAFITSAEIHGWKSVPDRGFVQIKAFMISFSKMSIKPMLSPPILYISPFGF